MRQVRYIQLRWHLAGLLIDNFEVPAQRVPIALRRGKRELTASEVQQVLLQTFKKLPSTSNAAMI